MSDALAGLFDALRRSQHFALVEHQDDPAVQGKRAYSIGGSTLQAVQTKIDQQMRVVEVAGGVGEFLSPMSYVEAVRKHGDVFMVAPYVSLGYTIIKQASA